MMERYCLSVIIVSVVLFFVQVQSKPIVDPGLFMILGVETCRNGTGYCLLGVDCTLDEEFVGDDKGGHCEGLKSAFTPAAHFTCCKYKVKEVSSIYVTGKRRTTTETILSTTTPAISSNTNTDVTTEQVVTTYKNEISSLVVSDELPLKDKVALETSVGTTVPATDVDVTTDQADQKNVTSETEESTTVLPYLDVNDEVIKEVKPPMLNASVSNVNEV